MSEVLNTFWTMFNNRQDYPILQMSIILLMFWLFSVLVRFLLNGIVHKLTQKTETDLDDQLLATFYKPISIGIICLGVYTSIIYSFDITLWKTPLKGILVTLVVLFWAHACLGYSKVLIETLAARTEPKRMVQPRTKPIFLIIIKALVFLGGSYFIIFAWGLDFTGWLASAGVAGIAIGFAAKDTLANFISGIFIIADAPYKIGDYIVLDDGDRGRVTDIGIRSTRLLTRDDVEVIIPNAVIGNSRITNQSGGPYEAFRLRVPVGVAYGSDIDHVQAILMEQTEEEELVLADPKPRIRFRAFGNSSLDFELLVWVETPELRGLALHKLLCNIYKAFGRAGIEIPFPKRDVYLHHVDQKED